MLMSPANCSVLALASYIFANPGLTDSDRDGYGRLFPVGYQYSRFMDCLQSVNKKKLNKFVTLGISPSNLGSHLTEWIVQLCQRGQYCVPTNGKHLLVSNVEYG